jgi:long-chain acyl-CoA synthetase
MIVTGATSIVGDYVGPCDVLLAYLPLAHIFEFVFENASLYWGSVIGYGNSKTLSNASMRNCKGDIQELKPTLMVGVPAVWETVRTGIIQKVGQLNTVARIFFWTSFYLKQWLVRKGLPGIGILDAIVFKKVTEATGGRLRLCLTGAGPIAKGTQEFISLVIAPLINGYGLTETSAYEPTSYIRLLMLTW